MRLSKFIFGIVSVTLLAQASLAENIAVVNAGGVRLSVIADFPPGEGRSPAIVLAPGQGYHMSLPAMEATARSLTEQGIAVFRFDWAYFTAEPKGQPSDDLSKELQDLQAVLAAARVHSKVLAQNLSVGGKSLGSIVAWRAFAADSQLRSALLLTPVCSRVPKGETLPRSEAKENYPGFEIERRPTLSISGDKDLLCAPAVLYGLAAASHGAARVAIVGGDHSYESRSLPPPAAEAARRRNLAAVSGLAASFVSEASSTLP
jgi:predicted alpha/beta-hydrolase family hydrolase